MIRFAVAMAATLATPASAVECWTASNFRGQTAQADGGYRFKSDSFADGMLICVTAEGGMVRGNDLDLVRLGDSTLMGWVTNGLGLEVVNVYQIDRRRGVLLVTQSRIGTATVTPLLPDYAAVFVADLARLE
ncbi:hypothetical protein [Rhodobaculum claviforme]|uniref:Uncharacterized protein n=1 Tax=Rhodobaculum claviforme TaxID=1549854 RepID=A0A934WJ78_9RHOB|nr:hypothetical protein [Rhodobaculum claviforme]MBK5927569.1 hypothetical protein [Rhodobaculum claviforme]